MQPEQQVSLFDGRGGEWTSTILSMGRKIVEVRIETHMRSARTAPHPVTLAVGMPMTEWMLWWEKATELREHTPIQPLMLDRSVLRLDGERLKEGGALARRGRGSLQSNQGGPAYRRFTDSCTLSQWLQVPGAAQAWCGLLSLGEVRWDSSVELVRCLMHPRVRWCILSGPEGGCHLRGGDGERRAGRFTGRAGAARRYSPTGGVECWPRREA